jgi:hypothetical protein
MGFLELDGVEFGVARAGNGVVFTTPRPLLVMPGLVPGIHVLFAWQQRRGWPGQARP